ncbi:MAG: PilZ domain-containing protein [Acetivibrionales bacterium]
MVKKLLLGEFIETNSIIETKSQGRCNWIITSVLNVFGDFLEVRQVTEYLSCVLMIGDKVSCKYVTKDSIYLLEAEVYNVKFALKSVVFKVNDIKKIENSRKHKRYDVHIGASFKKKHQAGEIYCVIMNISAEGLSIVTRALLKIGEKIFVSIYNRGFHFLTAECIVKWHDVEDTNHMYGLAIVNMDELSRVQYRDFMSKLRRKVRHARKKAEKLIDENQ